MWTGKCKESLKAYIQYGIHAPRNLLFIQLPKRATPRFALTTSRHIHAWLPERSRVSPRASPASPAPFPPNHPQQYRVSNLLSGSWKSMIGNGLNTKAEWQEVRYQAKHSPPPFPPPPPPSNNQLQVDSYPYLEQSFLTSPFCISIQESTFPRRCH